ncbi:MAG: hypothetical protein J5927_01370 [Oscillospiraceae bacterium]|nr:hypothetical protein [Oscillospiraceae bacterium]
MKKILAGILFCFVLVMTFSAPVAFAVNDEAVSSQAILTNILSGNVLTPRLFLIIGLTAALGLLLVLYFGKKQRV